MKKKINKDTIIGLIIIFFLSTIAIKLVIFDCIIGTKVYNKNEIIIKYHRYINLLTIKNNSKDKIYMHYQTGRCKQNNIEDRSCSKIKYYKKSDDFEIKEAEKITKFIDFFADAYIFTVSNEKDLYDSVGYKKRDVFN